MMNYVKESLKQTQNKQFFVEKLSISKFFSVVLFLGLTGCSGPDPSPELGKLQMLRGAVGQFIADFSWFKTIPFINNDKAICSGVLVEGNKIITARHCVFPPDDDIRLPKDRARKAEVVFGDGILGYSREEFDVLDNKPNTKGVGSLCESRDLDIAVFKIEDDSDLALYSPVDIAPLSSEVVVDRDILRMIHFPDGGKQKGPETCKAYEIKQPLSLGLPESSFRQYLFAHDCYSEKGSSGAPIFNDNDQLVAIHIGSAEIDGYTRGVAVRIPRARGQLRNDCLPTPQCSYGSGPNCVVNIASPMIIKDTGVAVCSTAIHALQLPNTPISNQPGFTNESCIRLTDEDSVRPGVRCTIPVDKMPIERHSRNVNYMAKKAHECIQANYGGIIGDVKENLSIANDSVCLKTEKREGGAFSSTVRCPESFTEVGAVYPALRVIDNSAAYFDIGSGVSKRRMIVSRGVTADDRDVVTIASAAIVDLEKTDLQRFLRISER